MQDIFRKMMLMKKIILVIVLIAFAFILLCVRVIFKKNGQFGSQHISQNKRMRQDGIHCATSQDREIRTQHTKKMDIHQL